MKCAVKTCEDPASAAIVLNVPALGMPIREHDPVTMIIGLALCAACLQKEDAKEWFAPWPNGDPSPHRRIVEIQIKSRGLGTPDFDRAFVTGLSLESAEWKMLRGGRSP